MSLPPEMIKKTIEDAEEFTKRIDNNILIISPAASSLSRWYPKEPGRLSERVIDVLNENRRKFRYAIDEKDRFNIAVELLDLRDALQHRGYLTNDLLAEENIRLKEENSSLNNKLILYKAKLKKYGEKLEEHGISVEYEFLEGEVESDD